MHIELKTFRFSCERCPAKAKVISERPTRPKGWHGLYNALKLREEDVCPSCVRKAAKAMRLAVEVKTGRKRKKGST